jgi:hypothetical protein
MNMMEFPMRRLEPAGKTGGGKEFVSQIFTTTFLKLLPGCRVFLSPGAVGFRRNRLNQQLMNL